jgi:hypothetical protein
MDLEHYRTYPVVGEMIFGAPTRSRYAWAFFGFTALFGMWMLVDRGPRVGILAGGGLLLLSVPNVLPECHYRLCVVLRVVGIVYYVALWGAIFLLFPDAPTFFQGNW